MSGYPLRNVGLSGLILLLVAATGAALLSVVHEGTRDRIAAQQRRLVLENLNQIIPPEEYDNALQADYYDLQAASFFQHKALIRVWRARLGEENIAVIMQVTTPNGYNGDIQLLVGIDTSGTIRGVRVTAHKETPGLGGDKIEVKNSHWILGFDGRTLKSPLPAQWDVKRRNGVFDQFTGATITPSAI